jgi:hypothetical protein
LDTETLDINGEIQNNGTEPLDFVKVTATFYDVSNSVLGNDYTFTKPYTLEPGQSAPFRLNVDFRPATNTIPINEIASIKLYISLYFSEHHNINIEISEARYWLQSCN